MFNLFLVFQYFFIDRPLRSVWSDLWPFFGVREGLSLSNLLYFLAWIGHVTCINSHCQAMLQAESDDNTKTCLKHRKVRTHRLPLPCCTPPECLVDDRPRWRSMSDTLSLVFRSDSIGQRTRETSRQIDPWFAL